ncbi:MAG TPA: TIGR04255 family protein, partial [Methylomirabilota bacterium]|nr:TIGR04255 family protein [Methylomirabilota bacterium]
MSRHYLKAPITEALIDLKVTLPEAFPPDDLAHIYERISDRFPTQESIQTGSLVFQSGPTIRVDTSQQHSGFLFRSKDGMRIFQA